MNYLQNYILHNQLKYPEISPTPVSVLRHLLFCNGNGCEILDGNFVAYFEYGTYVPYTILYASMNSRQDIIKEQDDREGEVFIDRTFVAKILNQYSYDEYVIWKECVDKWDSRFDGVTFVDGFSEEDLTSPKVLYDLIANEEYAPYLGLSSGYYKADYFNENTDKYLLLVTKALTQAYIRVLSEILDGKLEKESSLIGAITEDTLREVYRRDIEELVSCLSKINMIIKDK